VSSIRVVIADDQTLFAGSLKIVLEGYGNGEIEVTGVAYNGQEAVDLVEKTMPDLVLMDVRMPVMDGVEATRLIHNRYAQTKIMILTTFDDDDYVQHALANGAVAYVLKEIRPEELITAVKAVHSGSYLISPSVGSKLVNKIGSDTTERSKYEKQILELKKYFPSLSHREAEVLYLITQSYDNHEIAEELFIAEQTVKNYVSVIYTKLGVSDRVHAVRLVKDNLSQT
jgi:DNA-binding NarL/FixJ family response regulator